MVKNTTFFYCEIWCIDYAPERKCDRELEISQKRKVRLSTCDGGNMRHASESSWPTRMGHKTSSGLVLGFLSVSSSSLLDKD